ncbi:hypothetical protein HY480_02730 [Candidatus Uhrbacteria bacterium]|nr:hypothetical protein [Candidatus Uhrbacteria bacterium]
MQQSVHVRRAAIVMCAVVVLIGTALAPLRADAASGAFSSFFNRIGQWFRNTIARVFVRPVSPPTPVAPSAPPPSVPATLAPALPEGWTLDRGPLRIPAGTSAAEREAIERAYRMLGGVPVDPRGGYRPDVGPSGQPIPSSNTSPAEERAMDAAVEAAVRRAQQQLRQRAATPN